MLKFILFCILLCFIGAGYAAYQYAGVMGVLGFIGLIFLGLIALPIIFKLVLQKYLVGPLKEGLKTMFKHLEGAELEVHSVHKTIQPDYYTPECEEDYYDEDDFDDEYEEDEEEFEHEPYTPSELDWYEVDMTITPALPKGGEPEETWEVGMLQIVSPQQLQIADQIKKLKDESREDIDDEDDDAEDSSDWARDIGRFWLYLDGDFKEVLLWDDAEEPDDEYYELTGPQRVKLEISVPKGAPRAKLITNFRDLIEFDLAVEEPSRIIYQD